MSTEKKLPSFTANGQVLKLTDTTKVNGAGNRLFVGEIHFPDGSKAYLKHYQSGNGVAKDVAADVEVFDSAKGKVTRAKKDAPSLQQMIAEAVAAAMAASASKA